MNEYTVKQNGTTSNDVTILGNNLLDAINHNMAVCRTSNIRGADRRYTKRVFAETERHLRWLSSGWGGTGCAELILRNETDTMKVWIKTPKAEWDAISQGQDVITI